MCQIGLILPLNSKTTLAFIIIIILLHWGFELAHSTHMPMLLAELRSRDEPNKWTLAFVTSFD